VPTLPVVEDLTVSKIALASSRRVRHGRRLSSSVCIRPQNDLIIASPEDCDSGVK
jgi:hypothetical protein